MSRAADAPDSLSLSTRSSFLFVSPMPKSSSSPNPPRSASDPTDPNLVRKKKNADAQAAFRARRQNYISTLEETVTSLESVVIQLQDSCRETRNENSELRQENSRLRYENREREKYWKAFVQARKSGPQATFSAPSTSALLHPPDSYTNTLSYRSDPSASQAYDSSSFVEHHTPAVAFTNHNDVDASSAPHPDRNGKFATYLYSIPDSPRDPRWQLPSTLPTCLSSSGAVTPQSPSFMESPSLTAPTDLAPAYPGRFPTNDRKVALDAALSSAPYVFPGGNRYQNLPESIPHSRSMSPTTSASSATSLPLMSSYQMPFQDPSTAQGQPDFVYRGQSHSRCPEVTLHGGIADISLAAAQHPDSVRYRITRRSDSNADNQDHLPIQQQNDGHEDGTTRIRGSRRNLVAHPYRRSQSPGPTPLSSTVAVIKAQAFGALRRTRAKPKKTTDSAARVAQDVLEARGIGPTAKHHEVDDVGKP